MTVFWMIFVIVLAKYILITLKCQEEEKQENVFDLSKEHGDVIEDCQRWLH